MIPRHIWEEYLETSEDIRYTLGNKEIYMLRKETIDLYVLPSIFCMLAASAFIWLIAWFSFRSPAQIAASVSPADALKRQSEAGPGRRKKKHIITPGWLGWQYCCFNKKRWPILFCLCC